MKKIKFKSGIIWLSMLLLLVVLVSSQLNIFTMTALFSWLILPIISWVLNYYNRTNISLRMIMPPKASKNEGFIGKIIVKHDGVLPIGSTYGHIHLENHLTKEVKSQWIQLPVISKGQTEREFVFESVYSGYIEVKVDEMLLMDWFGFLSTKMEVYEIQRSSVMPDTFSLDVIVSASPVQGSDSETWSQVHKGNDYTEVFGLREYIPGDNLKRIHWKLSSKLNELIVKEPSLPTEKSLLLFWDKNTTEASAKEMDAMAEVVTSVAQDIGSQGIPYTLGWTEGDLIILEDVDRSEDLLSLIPRMIKTGGKNSESSSVNIQGNNEMFGKVIYVSKEIPENTSIFDFSEMIMVIGSHEQDKYWRTVNYMTDTYTEDLQKIQL